MTVAIEQVLVRCRVSREELDLWIARRWLRPAGDAGGPRFSETDIARIELIADLARDMGIDPEAIDVILPLVDQLYALRRSLRAVTEAVGELPEDTRREVLERIAARARR